MRPTWLRSALERAVHQPEAASWFLSRSDEISRPAVGKVHRVMITSTARCRAKREGSREIFLNISVASLLGVGLANVPDHDGKNRNHDDNGNGSTASKVAATAEHPVKHEVGQHLRVPLAIGHGQNDVKHLEHQNGNGGPHNDDGSHDLRHHDTVENLEGSGAIYGGRFQCV